ncbi:DNA repair protein RecN [Maridesulfovibrio bastinii]|uniref:DNA repair protein RecN n=1 Tax=Maridesulfovibrio bastinii TaxID=47157 RepID=UPI0004286E97|nr:AAA family ATPase [Maridesulfovibrio bastinii]
MLELLRIKNLALIEDAEIEFASGMNVLTGETGAGKSFILRAIDFLTGQRMSTEMIRPGRDKATVEALFVTTDGEEKIIRRELVSETGRSRVYVNDKLSSQSVIKELGSSLILHTSQHAQQKLLQPSFQCRILDTFLETPELAAEKDQAYSKLRDTLAKKENLKNRSAALEEKRDFLEFQRNEIEKVAPYQGEEDELLEKKAGLKQNEQAGKSIQKALDLMLGVTDLSGGLSALSTEMERVCDFFQEYEEDLETINEFRLRLDDISERLRIQPSHADMDESLDDIEERLYELSKLKRKLGKSLEEIVNLQKEIEQNISFLDSCSLDIKRLEKQEKIEAAELAGIVEKLNAQREKAAILLTDRIMKELTHLGFSKHVRIKFDFEPHELHPGIMEERGRLLWIPNPGQSPQPLDKIASGGELSRFLLAIAGLQGELEKPTLIFDEVDAGIGGTTLNRVGEKMRDLAARQQLVVITHWPQLAKLAERHFLIHKEISEGETFTTCRQLEGNKLTQELERMSGKE